MKIGYLTATKIPDDWAHVLQILHMCEAFVGAEVELELIAPKRGKTIETNAYKYAGVDRVFKIVYLPCVDLSPGSPSKLLFFLRSITFFMSARLYLVGKEFDALYTREHLAGLFFKKLFYEVHSLPTGGKGLYKKLWKRIAGFIVITSAMRDLYLREGISPDSIHVAPDAVTVDSFTISLTKEESRRNIGIDARSFVMGYVGTLKTMRMEKGVRCGIESLTYLPDEVMFLVAGGEPEDVEEYRLIAREAGVEHRVMLTGKVQHSDIPMYLKACDVVVAPFPDIEHYRLYMSPLKIFEYMAAKVPMVVSDLPSLREVLTDNTAVFIPPADSTALAHAVIDLMSSPEKRSGLAEAAYEDARNRFSWRARAQGIIQFITSRM